MGAYRDTLYSVSLFRSKPRDRQTHVATHVLVRRLNGSLCRKSRRSIAKASDAIVRPGCVFANIRVDPKFNGSHAEDFVPFARKPNCAALCVISAGNGVNAVKSGSVRPAAILFALVPAVRSFVRSFGADASRRLREMTISRAKCE